MLHFPAQGHSKATVPWFSLIFSLHYAKVNVTSFKVSNHGHLFLATGFSHFFTSVFSDNLSVNEEQLLDGYSSAITGVIWRVAETDHQLTSSTQIMRETSKAEMNCC